MTLVQGKQEVPENECLWEQSSTSNDGDLVNTEPISALKGGNLDVSYSASQTFQKSCASVALSGSQLNKVHLYRFLLFFFLFLYSLGCTLECTYIHILALDLIGIMYLGSQLLLNYQFSSMSSHNLFLTTQSLTRQVSPMALVKNNIDEAT